MTFLYSIKRAGKYLVDIDCNENYKRGACSPTGGNNHTYCEYFTTWGKEPKYFEQLTLANNIRVICEEYRHGVKKPLPYKIDVIDYDTYKMLEEQKNK